MKITAALLALTLSAGVLAACAAPVGPAGQPSSTDVNPVTGSRGGSGSAR